MAAELAVPLTLVLVTDCSPVQRSRPSPCARRASQLVQEGRRSAKAIAMLRANPERFLATVQIGITVVSAAAAAYGGGTLAAHLTPPLATVLRIPAKGDRQQIPNGPTNEILDASLAGFAPFACFPRAPNAH